MRAIVPCNETIQEIVQLIVVKKHTKKKKKTATELGGLKEGRRNIIRGPVLIPASPPTSVNKKEEEKTIF